MAKANQLTAPADQPGTEVAVADAQPDFFADQGAGQEGATQDSYALPFLTVLQKGSPQVDEASGQALEGAKQGMFFENVTGKLYDGKKGVMIIPCAFRHVYVHWGPKEGGNGGFKGEMLPEEVNKMRASGVLKELDRQLLWPMENGAVDPKRCDRAADTRNHYVLIVQEDGTWTRALLSLGSTQIKKSKMLMANLAGLKIKGPNGMFTPPTFASLVRATTMPESNDKGAWMGVKFENVGLVNRKDLYEAAKEFNHLVRAGTVEAKYESAEPEAQEQAGHAGGTF